MAPKMVSRTALLILLMAFASPVSAAFAAPRLVAYYFGKRALSGFDLSRVPVGKLTHLIYAFAQPTAAGECALPLGAAEKKDIESFTALRRRNPSLKILIAVGGWGGSQYFSDVAASAAAREKFSRSCLSLIQAYGFDGLDLDWEYPVTGGAPEDHKLPDDRANFVLLASRLRADLGTDRLLTLASSAYVSRLQDFDLAKLGPFVDWLNLMAYDFLPTGMSRTAHVSALYPIADAGVKWAVKQGLRPAQIVFGVPFYGHAWAKVGATADGLGQSFQGSPAGGEDGDFSAAEIETRFLPTAKVHWDAKASAAWLYDPQRGIMVSYENERSLRAKADYVAQAGLGGVMFWELGDDDSGFHLLTHLARALSDSLAIRVPKREKEPHAGK